MRKTTLILLGVLFLIVGCAYYEWTVGFVHVARLTGDSKVPVEIAPGLPGTTPQMMMDVHRARYHLPPDGRIVMALAIVSAFPDKVEAPVTPHFQNGSWQLSLAHGEVTLPELPSFDQTLVALRQQASATLSRAQLASGRSTEGYVGFEPRALLHELQLANTLAGNGITPALLRRTAAAACRLAYSTPDATQTADILAARCMAMTVLAEAATATALPEEMSIAASIFEFTDNALTYGAELPEAHPWRAYLERNDALLESRSTDPYAGYLLLRRYATRQMGDSWREHLQLTQGQMQPHQLMTVYPLSEHDVTMQVMLAIPSLLWPMVTDRGLPAVEKKEEEAQEQVANAPVTRPFDLLAELGNEIAKTSSTMQGPLFSADEYQAVYHAYLYSSLYRAAYTALDLRSSQKEAEAVQAVIAASQAPEAVQFSRWYRHLIDAEYGKADLRAMRSDLNEVTAFGSQLVIDTARKLNRQYGDASADALDLLERYSKRLDSRLGNRQEFAGFANKLLVLGVAEDMYGSLAEQAKLRYPRLNAWYYNSRGELSKVKEIAFDKRIDHRNRINAQDLLANTDGYDSQLADAFETTSQAEPLDWSSRELLVNYLEHNNKIKEAREVTVVWLKHAASKDNLNSFDYWNGAIKLAELELKLGASEQAWGAVEPLLETNYGPVYSQAIKVALAMGRVDRATEIARRAIERYPDSTPLMNDMMAVAWAGGFYSEAARALRVWGQPAPWGTWQKYFAQSFAEAFVGKPQDAHLAMDSLLQAGNDRWKLQTFSEAVDRAGNPQLAYELQLKLIDQGAWRLPTTIRGYKSLKKSVGEDEAVNWLKSQLQGMPHDYIAMGLMEGYDYSLLWRVTKPFQSRYPSSIWLYRAVGYVTGKASSSEYTEELMDYYKSAGEDDRYDLYGKYLMGLVPEERIKNLTLDRRGISEAAYYLGLGAAKDERYRDMVDWMRVSLDTRDERNGEYRYASTLLIRWRESGGVDNLVRNGMLF